MKRRTLLQTIPGVAALPAGWASLRETTKLPGWGGERASAKETGGKEAEPGQASTAVYELRGDHADEGKLGDLVRRFRGQRVKRLAEQGRWFGGKRAKGRKKKASGRARAPTQGGGGAGGGGGKGGKKKLRGETAVKLLRPITEP